MKKAFVLPALLAAMIPLQSFAVDGYKSLKFGMTEKEVLSEKICSLAAGPAGIPGFSMLGCTDLSIGGNQTEGTAYFINGKLQRFGIELPWNEVTTITKELNKKYGASSFASPRENWIAIDNEPNASAVIAWDNRSIYILMETDAHMNKMAVLIYTDPSFDSQLGELRQAAIGDDL